MDDLNPMQPSKSADIRIEFDKILMQHVSSLIDTREDIAALPFNLATIACLLLLAERENEIKSFQESPPERYNRETFFADIEEIGLDLDEDVLTAIRNLEQYGFVVINPQGQYTARESATLLIMVLDAIFPQMPGMNLVAYVSQSIEEVVSGRKEHQNALRQFDQTLSKQGVKLSALPPDRLSSSVTGRILPPDAPDPEMLLERRTAYLQKLNALRKKSLTSDASPTIVVRSAGLKNIIITELFPKNVVPPETVDTLPEPSPDIPDMSPQPDVLTTDVLDRTSLTDPETDFSVPVDAPAISETPLDTPATEKVLEVDESVSENEFSADTDVEEGLEETLSKEELIERRIREFETDLAMPCPVCGNGKVLSDTTEKGKTYYHCSNEECRLITWGKPYHMECPVCKNPFLIEVPGPDGQISLKCPRATCLYRKKGILPELAGDAAGSEKKRVAVVKKRKKGVRRVVRRKV